MTDWKFHPARDLALHGLERHRSLSRENGLAASITRLFWWCLLRLYFSLWHSLRVTGGENLPTKPPFILIGNHTSHLDALLLASILPAGWRDRVFPVAASDTFFEKRPTAAFADWFLNALAIRRKCARSHDLEEIRDKLAVGGAVLIIFPEGTRSRTGALQAFHGGIGRLVAQSNIPVIPCHLDGCFRALPPGSQLAKPVPISLRIDPPLLFNTYADNRAGWDAVARKLHEAFEMPGA